MLSDVHGNLTALQAVLAAEPLFDQVVFCGDAVDYGPDPAGCLARLAELAPISVRGNHDNAVAFDVDCGCSEAFRHVSKASRLVTRSILTPDDRAALGRLPTEVRFSVGGAIIHLTHATPRDNLFEYAFPDRDPEGWAKAMRRPETDLVVVGHTHRPYVRTLGRQVVLNPGSVGQPRDGDPRASYATWEDGRVSLKRVPYDLTLALRELSQLDLPRNIATALSRILETGGAGSIP